MKKRVILSTINVDPHSFALSIEFLAAKVLSDPRLSRNIRLIKKTYPARTHPQKILKQILSLSPHLIGFSCYVWNITQLLEVASAIKEAHPRTLIVLGGPETAGRGGDILEEHPYIDGVVMGEGEESFARLLAGWLQDDRLGPVPGVAVRQGGRISISPSAELLEDLDKNPSPYDNMKLSTLKPDYIVPFQTLRGCNRNCFYCYYGKDFPTVRFFSRQRINNDLEKIKAKGGRSIGIIDPNFFCHRTHASDVLGMLAEKKLRFQLEVSAEELDEEDIDLLAESVCYQVSFGLQSSNQKALKLAGRSSDLQRLEGNIRLLAKKAPNISLYADLICGLPGDSLEDFLNSIDFALSLPLESINFFHLQALPGTLFRREAKKLGIKFNPHPPYLVYQTRTFSPAQIKRANMVSIIASSFLGYCALRPVTHYILKKIPDTPSRLFVRMIDWDNKRKKWMETLQARKAVNLAEFRYYLSCIDHFYPGVFSALELKYLYEWYKFSRCFHRLEQKPPSGEENTNFSDKESAFWKRSDNLVMGRFRIKPRLHHEILPTELLKEKRLVLQKGPRGVIRIYEISEEIERLLIYFRRPKPLKSYISAPGSEPAVERHIRVQYAKEKGFIRAVRPGQRPK